MHISDLQEKLAKLSPDLNLYLNNRVPHKSQYIYGLYGSTYTKDTLIGGVSGPNCPEFTQYDYESGIVVLRGWRDVLHLVINKGYCTRRKAEKVFRTCLSYDYDYLRGEDRLEWMKKKDGWEDTALKPGESIYIDKWGKKHKVPADSKIINELMRESSLCGVK